MQDPKQHRANWGTQPTQPGPTKNDKNMTYLFATILWLKQSTVNQVKHYARVER